ncbi:MAG: 5'-nucleotidase domain-containing protein, partial [Salinibacter sp.]
MDGPEAPSASPSRSPPELLRFMDATDSSRGLFCNRTLNLRGIQAIGYDMDYTLIHYHM